VLGTWGVLPSVNSKVDWQLLSAGGRRKWGDGEDKEPEKFDVSVPFVRVVLSSILSISHRIYYLDCWLKLLQIAESPYHATNLSETLAKRSEYVE